MIKKKIIIFGSEGQLGKSFFYQKNNNFNYFFFNKKKADITKKNHIKDIINKINPSVIINCVAYTDVDKAEVEIKLSKKVNYLGIKNIVDIIKNKKILLIHFSTDFIFNGKKKYAYRENDNAIPLSQYGNSKLLADNYIVKNISNYLIFRISGLYTRFNKNFLKNFINMSENKLSVSVICNNQCRPTNGIILANFILNRINYFLINNKCYGIYHFSDGGNFTSWYRIVQLIYSQMKSKRIITPNMIKINHLDYPFEAKRPFNSKLNILKTSKQFNYKFISWKKNLINEMKEIIK